MWDQLVNFKNYRDKFGEFEKYRVSFANSKNK